MKLKCTAFSVTEQPAGEGKKVPQWNATLEDGGKVVRMTGGEGSVVSTFSYGCTVEIKVVS